MRSNTYSFGAQQFLPQQGWFGLLNSVNVFHAIPTTTIVPISTNAFHGYNRIIGTITTSQVGGVAPLIYRSIFTILQGDTFNLNFTHKRVMPIGTSMPNPNGNNTAAITSRTSHPFDFPLFGSGISMTIETVFCGGFPGALMAYNFNAYLVPV